VARDRQRSKARQRARAAKNSPAAGRKHPRSRAEEIGLDDPSVDEAGLTDETPTPDPLKNAMPDVDQAKAAETGLGRPEAGEPIDLEEDDLDLDNASYDDRDRAPDELELPSDLAAEGSRGGGGGGGMGGGFEGEEPGPPRKERGRLATFLRGCIDELKRVQWPDRPHVFQATAVVLGFCLVAGGFLGLMDAIWQPLINAIL
jgi:preprotein translocase SecE subunit